MYLIFKLLEVVRLRIQEVKLDSNKKDILRKELLEGKSK